MPPPKAISRSMQATRPPPVESGGFHWIDGDLSLEDSVYGTPTYPLLLVVKGNLSLSRRTTINGVVLVLGGASVTVSGGTVNGILAAEGNVMVTNMATLTYSDMIIQAVRKTVGPYVEVPGSWKDF